MTDLLEKDWQNNVIELAHILGWRVAHFRPAQTGKGWRTPMQGDKGFPDLVLARAGRVVFAELKSETGRMTADQEAWQQAIQPDPLFEPSFYVWRPSDLKQVQEVLSGR